MQYQAWLLDSRRKRDESHPVQQQGPHAYDLIMLKTFFDNKDEMDLSDFYHATSPYVVTRHIEGTRNVKYFTCCSEPYIDLNFR